MRTLESRKLLARESIETVTRQRHLANLIVCVPSPPFRVCVDPGEQRLEHLEAGLCVCGTSFHRAELELVEQRAFAPTETPAFVDSEFVHLVTQDELAVVLAHLVGDEEDPRRLVEADEPGRRSRISAAYDVGELDPLNRECAPRHFSCLEPGTELAILLTEITQEHPSLHMVLRPMSGLLLK